MERQKKKTKRRSKHGQERNVSELGGVIPEVPTIHEFQNPECVDTEPSITNEDNAENNAAEAAEAPDISTPPAETLPTELLEESFTPPPLVDLTDDEEESVVRLVNFKLDEVSSEEDGPFVPLPTEAGTESFVPLSLEAEPESFVPLCVEAEPESFVPLSLEAEPESFVPLSVEADESFVPSTKPEQFVPSTKLEQVIPSTELEPRALSTEPESSVPLSVEAEPESFVPLSVEADSSESFAPLPVEAESEESFVPLFEDEENVAEANHTGLADELHSVTENGRLYPLVQEAETCEELDPCEEALSILAVATAPINFESGDFYSLPSLEKPVNVLDFVEEESDVLKPDEKAGHRSQIQSFYNNYLLENNNTCVKQFLDSLQPACDGFELFELLSNYLRACNHLTGCEKALSTLKENCDEFEKGVWSLRIKNLSQNTTCEDGVTLTASYKVHVAEFSSTTFGQLTRTLKDIKELLKDSFSLYTYSVQLSRTQIEHFLFKSFGHFNLESFQVQNYSPGYPSPDVRGFAALLKRTLTVCFHFLRKPLLHVTFVQDIQDWVSRCSGLLLRIATIEDHIFLLNHVIRLPPRLVSKFAASLVQVPPIPIPTNPNEYSASFGHLHVDYALTLLATILSPVPNRNQMLSHFQSAPKMALQDTSLQWVLVDSDGEDDETEECPFFREADLIALLQQVPFDKVFRRIMLIYTDGHGGEDVLDLSLRSEHSVLKLIAFGSQLIAILGNGLVTYYTDRYRQLMKLIGRLILHTIQYVTDQLELFVEAGGRSYTGVTVSPVFSEYDIFLFDAVSVLLTGKNVGMSQFLAAVPYHFLSTQMLWEVYALLTKWDWTVSEDISAEFENELIAMTESNSFYTLTTMSNMALARQGKENQFVKVVTFHLFQIGFLSPVTRDACSKSVRDLLGNLSSYPKVISNLLQNIKQKIDVLSKLALFLVRELDFGQWIPTSSDLQLISSWMLNFHTFSLENQLARFILQSMNWDFGDCEDLFLPEEIHARVALLVVESHYKWEKPQNVISESVKQLSSWVTRNPDFTSWTWAILNRLHLHGYDRHKSTAPRMGSLISKLPTFESNPELDILKRGIDEKNPVACAVALLLTPIGHSLPVLCTHGFDLLEILLQNSKFDVVINLLFFLIPLFTGSRESIVTCEKFRNILTTLLGADMTYVRLAKSLITTEFPGSLTRQFGEMVHAQLNQHFRFGTTKRRLILLWLDLLTKIQGWNKDNNILYLLDVVAEFSFSDDAQTEAVFYGYFTAMYKELPTQNSSGIVGFLFNWSYNSRTVLPNSSYPQMPYLVYFILTIESTLESESGFWKSLSKSLENPKITLENAVKKACSSSKYSTTSSYLTIYRWAQHALELPITHPLLLIFWQKFFLKYFFRAAASEAGNGGIGERFFEGMINTAFLKKLKKRLHETLQYYTDEMNILESDTGSVNDNNSGENTAFILEHFRKCFTLVNGMTLWIEDSTFHQDSLYIPALPPQYLPVLLHTLVEGDFGDWSTYIDVDEIQLARKTKLQNYLTQISRNSWTGLPGRTIPKSATWNSSIGNNGEEMLKRLNSYDLPVEPPPVPNFPQILPSITSPMFTEIKSMESGLKEHLTHIQEFAGQFSLQISKHTALDCTYWDNLPDLYTVNDSEALVNVECSSKKSYACSGPGHVIFKFSEARLNERVGHIIHSNRTDYHNLISQSLIQPPPRSISVGAVFIEDFITNLVLFHRNLTPRSKEAIKVEKIGTELFYLIVNRIKEETNFYPPSRQLLSSFLEVLGQEFLENDPGQCQRLVSACIARPELVGTLTPHMNLLKSSTEALLRIYEDIIHIPERNGDLTFVILSKLDLLGWLRKWKPKLIERSQLIFLMWKAVTSEESKGEKRNAMVHGIFRSHLKTMLLYDFPQHYGEILNLLLDDSEKGIVPLEIWYDFCNGLSRDTVRFSQEMDPFVRKRELKRFSMEVDMLRHQELFETASLLANHFKKQRLTFGIYGLYPKYRSYVHPLSSFLQMISYSLISSSLKNSKGSPSQQIVEAVWPFVRELYNPWILPYSQRMIQQESAQWIQQMNFDAVLQPWIGSDSNYAILFMNDFTDSVLFLAETLPGSPVLFSYLWNYYAENFAHTTVKEHVLSVVNNCFISIPWSHFWPTMSDMESMNKVVEKYLPACHSLMGVIFAQINWRDWVQQLHGSSPSVKSKCYAILLNLSVHLATDIVARESPTWTSVMETIQSLSWEFILPNSLEPVLNWFLMSIDPRVVLDLDSIHRLDKDSFQLIRIASGYGPCEENEMRKVLSPGMKTDLNRKRYLFVRTYIRLLISASTKYKHLLQTHALNFEKALEKILDDISIPVKNERFLFEGQERFDFGSHLKEVIGLIGNHSLGTMARNACITWFEGNQDPPLPFVHEILQLTFAAKVQPYTTLPLLEIGIPLAFRHTDGNWKGIADLALVVSEQSEQNQYLDVASKDGHFLTLYALLLNRSHFYTRGALQSVASLTEILKNVKPKESNEAALPLLYNFFCKISIILLNEGAKHLGGHLEKAVKKFLHAFCLHLTSVGDDKQGWVLLGVLGLTKSSLLSVRGRLFARCLGVFLMAQLPANAPVRLEMSPGDPVPATKTSPKPHGELESSLQKLEELKTNKAYLEFVDCIEMAITFIRDPVQTLSSHGIFIQLLVAQLFTEAYLLRNEF